MDIVRADSDVFFIQKDNHVKRKSMSHLHHHNYYELYYLTEGVRKYFIDDTIYELEEGDIVVIPPDILHRTVGTDKEFYSRILLCFPPELLNENLKNNEWINKYFCRIPKIRRKKLDDIFEKIEYEKNRYDEYSEYLINNYINEIFMLITRVANRTDSLPVSNETNSVISEAAKYIRQNYEKNITLDDVAFHVNMSRTYFSKLFKKQTGFGFSNYLIKVRINEAAKMLTDTEFSITDIALSCGFNDSSYFSSLFKKTMGVSPGKYKKIF